MCDQKGRPLAVGCVLALFSLPSTEASEQEKNVLLTGNIIFPCGVNKKPAVFSEYTYILQLHVVLIHPDFPSDSSHSAHPFFVFII